MKKFFVIELCLLVFLGVFVFNAEMKSKEKSKDNFSKRSDINMDGKVDIQDFSIFLYNWPAD